MGLWSLKNLLPFMGMVVVILSQVTVLQVMKAAMSEGKNKFTIMVYSNVLSIFVLLVSCLIKHRSDRPPPLNFSIICKFFLLSFIGCLMQIFSYVGIEYSSPTLATAMSNLVPAFTFILAIVFSLGAWCLSKKGPIYVTTFKPLAIVLSVVIGFLFLGDALSLGSLIGAIIIVAGFYSVMWGKAKEENTIEHSDVGSLKSSTGEKVPLLHNKIDRIIDA
ncbi:hypothetical protein Q3G72_031236 [Acer saccharum]|nr:hypothetical protein Q3G72_031236 [Acer saccharum]